MVWITTRSSSNKFAGKGKFKSEKEQTDEYAEKDPDKLKNILTNAWNFIHPDTKERIYQDRDFFTEEEEDRLVEVKILMIVDAGSRSRGSSLP